MAEEAAEPKLICPYAYCGLILNTRKPIVMRKVYTGYTCFDGGLEEWCKKLDAEHGEPIEFERMSRKSGSSPQWESLRKKVQMTAAQFLEEHGTEKPYWTAMNYKRSFEIPKACKENITFRTLGFRDSDEDCTFWLSSKGANTPCHYDTYGCNVVVQIFGKKLWWLFPPKTPFTTTRIPYEESSVYCTENFYSPKLSQVGELLKVEQNAYKVELNEGDVLIVPRHWWHYVETLETSLSINYWVPLYEDADMQIEETIVKFLIESFVKDSDQDVTKYILNPNQMDEIAEGNELFDILEKLLNKDPVESKRVLNNTLTPEAKRPVYPYFYDEESEVEQMLENIPYFTEVPHATYEEFSNFLIANKKRYDKDQDAYCSSPMNIVKETLINCICNPAIIARIKKQFCKRYEAHAAGELKVILIRALCR